MTTTINYDDGDDAHDDAYDDDAVMLMMLMINAMAYWHKVIMAARIWVINCRSRGTPDSRN